ncbi:type II toxin-antitoxin system RelE/ParE family toxin [Enterobacter oligotrophicus]|uniref:type II toxin-antitoxin system RelE family toxin n=1 Tax=Enterobacter TaxID=547 RepID=UPI001C02417D|nr:type II toxin-antitoxin system RelE/ParE family toxin [Enterobacter oligotrophicus]ELW1647740.1 type II toxin-antitoxin system RelE/ParE family toxin [Enterobacter oligotrophicus]MBT9427541.1 type II toxin-antitoxin system RelE/ParE family toxin [Enterobacter oligotrophicus]
MTYELEFDPRALKEWHKLGETVKTQFKKKLAVVLVNPRVESSRLNGIADCYKIKLKSSGYRLVYQVRDKVVTVFVVAVGKREKSAVYHDANKRL